MRNSMLYLYLNIFVYYVTACFKISCLYGVTLKNKSNKDLESLVNSLISLEYFNLLSTVYEYCFILLESGIYMYIMIS